MDTISNSIKHLFPILDIKVNNKPLIYFDNAATTQKPLEVIEAMNDYYKMYNSNIHRGAHYLANYATEKYEEARSLISNFINAYDVKEINFTKGTTESINLLAYSWGRKYVSEGDEILISSVEHHANIVPWQILCEEKNAILKVIEIDEQGNFNLEDFYLKVNKKTKLISINYVSNALGNINPVQEIIQKARENKILFHLDIAQAVQHFKIDVQKLNCDFVSFSGHKMYGPTGIGVFWGRTIWLQDMNPFLAGGEMIKTVTFEKTVYNDLPYKFEAGTPNIAGGIGLGQAVKFINRIGIEKINSTENELVTYCISKMKNIEGIILYGNLELKSSVVSFNIKNIHGYDIGVLLDKQGIAVRTGHHCCQPLMNCLGIEGTVRVSFAFYNTKEEIDVFIEALIKAIKMLS